MYLDSCYSVGDSRDCVSRVYRCGLFSENVACVVSHFHYYDASEGSHAYSFREIAHISILVVEIEVHRFSYAYICRHWTRNCIGCHDNV